MTQTNITTSGGLISTAFIENVREPASRQRGIEPESYALPWAPAPKSPAGLEDTIATAWELLLERWDAVRVDVFRMDISQLRARWLLPLFQLLGFSPVYLRSDTVLDEAGRLRYALSHRGWEGAGSPVLHSVAPVQDLDERAAAGRGIKLKSPHDMLQAFLNASPDDEWAVLSNGILLRLLRDYHHTFSKGYVQFDLESMFETRNYGDFRALYRLAHASRFLPLGDDKQALLPLELFYKNSLATGVKVGENLRGQVRQAIEILGNGFLDGGLIQQFQADAEACRDYYGEILHVIYRVLFLLFAEQRGLLPQAGAPLEDLYRGEYSITALRGRAEGDIPREDRFGDLWEGLRVTFRMVREGAPELGVFGYDGMLFEDDQDAYLHGRACPNGALLRAIRALTLIEREGVLQRISYADLGVEELGSIYESLLDYTPRVMTTAEEVERRQVSPNTFFLDPRGAARKTSGSYYTHPSLVNELIKSALLPVAWDRLNQAGLPVIEQETIGEAAAGLLVDYAELTTKQRQAGEAALLALKICDPAAGSGHFLVKADNILGAELARIRTGDEYPGEAAVQAARRDVLTHCIYAVDLNPMAVELCKVSLWINASVADRPLSFLDHHIKCGNSLVGATPELLEQGIPTDAFKAVTGDDRPTVNTVRKRNRKERKAHEKAGAYQMSFPMHMVAESKRTYQQWSELSRLAEAQPKAARERYAEYRTQADHRRRKLEADCWTAAFFWPIQEGVGWIPTHGEFLQLRSEGQEVAPPEGLAQIETLAEQYRFFHWHLEFPDVFTNSPPLRGEGSGEGSGFDVILGNPPWERIKLQGKEFFAGRDEAIANARTAAERRKLIKKLPQANPALQRAYTAALRESEASSHFLRNAGRFPLTAGGDINTYAVFAGLARKIIAPAGRAGLVVPTGIATDYTYRKFFADVMERGCLVSLYDFENRQKLFPEVDSRMKFSLLTLTAGGVPEAEFAFFLHSTAELADKVVLFNLTAQDLEMLSPDTSTMIAFRSKRDRDLTIRIYNRLPYFGNAGCRKEKHSGWQSQMVQGVFHSSNDSALFVDPETLPEKVCTRLYEPRMFHQYDHRFSTCIQRQFAYVGKAAHLDPTGTASSRYWVPVEEFLNRIGQDNDDWILAYRRIARSTDERTMIACIIPTICINENGVILKNPSLGASNWACLLANLCACVLDYTLRQNDCFSISNADIKQLPVLPPAQYSPALLGTIVPRVLELTYTAWDLQAFADDVWREADADLRAAIEQQWEDNVAATGGGHAGVEPPEWAYDLTPSPPAPLPLSKKTGEGEGGAGRSPAGGGGEVLFPHPPFMWDEERRLQLRCELDGLYAHLYGLTREELDYILDTFPIVRRKDEGKYGEYRTKRLVLQSYDVR